MDPLMKKVQEIQHKLNTMKSNSYTKQEYVLCPICDSLMKLQNCKKHLSTMKHLKGVDEIKRLNQNDSYYLPKLLKYLPNI